MPRTKMAVQIRISFTLFVFTAFLSCRPTVRYLPFFRLLITAFLWPCLSFLPADGAHTWLLSAYSLLPFFGPAFLSCRLTVRYLPFSAYSLPPFFGPAFLSCRLTERILGFYPLTPYCLSLVLPFFPAGKKGRRRTRCFWPHCGQRPCALSPLFRQGRRLNSGGYVLRRTVRP